jgi:hypothetical protein
MLWQLCSRANEDAVKKAYQKLVSELAEILAEISQPTNQTKSHLSLP